LEHDLSNSATTTLNVDETRAAIRGCTGWKVEISTEDLAGTAFVSGLTDNRLILRDVLAIHMDASAYDSTTLSMELFGGTVREETEQGFRLTFTYGAFLHFIRPA
jgi:hypothetical protein